MIRSVVIDKTPKISDFIMKLKLEKEEKKKKIEAKMKAKLSDLK